MESEKRTPKGWRSFYDKVFLDSVRVFIWMRSGNGMG
jgi:hypothetical protein